MNATAQRHNYHDVQYCEYHDGRFYGVCSQCGNECETKNKSDGSIAHWSAYLNGSHPKQCEAVTR